MKFVSILGLATVATAGVADSAIKKVVQQLQGMQQTLADEGKADEDNYDKQTKMCTSQEDNLTDMIRDNEDKAAAASADVEKFGGEVVEHNTEIEKLGQAIAAAEANLAQARGIRADENKDFQATEKELQEAVDAIVRAMSILRRGGAQKTVGTFAQIAQGLGAIVDASFIEESDRQQLKAFVQAATEEDEEGAPEGAAYSNHSTNILDLLNSMKKKAEGELQDARQTEMTQSHNFAMLEQSLTDQLKVDKANMAENSELAGQKGESKGQAAGDLADAEKGLAQDKAALQELRNSCATADSDFASRKKGREEEAAAVGEAIGILSGEKLFLQKDDDSEDTREQVSKILQAAADKYSSTAFAQLASRTRVGDAFGKVKGLIEDMIAKLQKQAVEEADKKAYCDTEKKKGDAERAKLSDRSDLLQTRKDKATADMAKAKADIATLSKEITEINQAVADATALRASQAEVFAKFVKDSNADIDALSNANQVLADYFNKDNSAGGYESGADTASGILGLLQTAQADVEQALSEATSQENTAKDEFKKFKNESEVQVSSKTASRDGKESQFKQLNEAHADFSQDHDSTSKELEAAIEGLAKLRETCVHQPMSFEERAQKRADEISSLKEALELLTPETSLIQRQITLHQ